MIFLSIILAGLFLYSFYPFLLLIFRQRISPLRILPGPQSPARHSPNSTWSSSLLAPFASFAWISQSLQWFLLGNLVEMHDMENTNLLGQWQDTYGPIFVYRGFVGGCRLMLLDDIAIAHIFSNAYEYPKPDFVRESLATMAAGMEGLLTSEGDMHKKQRKILTPAFSSQHIKSLAPVFWEKAEGLRDIWLRSTTTSSSPRVDVLSWLARATLDVIGEAGFGYRFDALLPQSENELANAFGAIFSAARKFRAMTILQAWFPVLRKFRPHSKTMKEAQGTMRRVGMGLIGERERAQDGTAGKDLLSLLIRSNSEERDAKDAAGKMSTEEVLCQISTFIAAGHETTASALVWTLWALAKDKSVQDKLRTALRELPDCTPGFSLTEAVEKCTYLDWVVRESLRLNAPVTSTMRVCLKDGGDEIPVGTPYTDRKGNTRTSISLNKWDIISIPLQAMNKSRAVWGEDADVFRPERHAEEHGGGAGMWGNILTFGGGRRGCIGYRFALLEMKIFLYVLLRDIEFSMPEGMVIEKRVNVVTRPFVKSEPELGNQMPLLMRRIPPNPGEVV